MKTPPQARYIQTIIKTKKSVRRLQMAAMITLNTALHGCASQPPMLAETCELQGGTPLISKQLPASSKPQTIEFLPPGAGQLCVNITRISRRDSSPISANKEDSEPAFEKTTRIALGANQALQSLAGGGSRTELNVGRGAWKKNRVGIKVATSGEADAFEIVSPLNGVRVDIFYDPEVSQFGGQGNGRTQALELPPVPCTGKIRGFRPLYEFGEATALYPPLKRKRVGVQCIAHWDVQSSPHFSHRVRVTSGFQWSNAQGQYNLTIPGKTELYSGKVRKPQLVKIEAKCLIPEQCGFEAKPQPRAVPLNFTPDTLPNILFADIVDVLDIASKGPALPKANGEPGPRITFGARLISSASTFPERNDKPVILHEQVDIFAEEHSNFLLWGLSGQPIKTRFSNDKDKFVTQDPRITPCDFDRERQLCVPFTEDCNPKRCGDTDRACLEYNMLQVMLDAGYDIWLVDMLRGDEDLAHAAAAAPLLYQRILNYGGPLDASSSVVPVSPPVENEIVAYSLNPSIIDPSLALIDLQQTMLRDTGAPTSSPRPGSGKRRAVVMGYSLGGVIARMGLRMWEIKDQLPNPQMVDNANNPLTLAQAPDVFLEKVTDKVALYVSLDAPHRGANIPIALQAYIRRMETVLDGFPGLTEAEKEEFKRAARELTALPSRQSIDREILSQAQESLGCWKIKNGEVDDIKNCTLRAFDAEITTRISSDFFGVFSNRWLETINTIEPTSLDGLPRNIPAIALSNGGLETDRFVSSQRLIDFKFDVDNYYDKHHYICDEFSAGTGRKDNCKTPGRQVAGAQWNGICQRLGGVNFKDIDLGACFTKEIGLGSCYATFLGVNLRDLEVTYPMRAKFEKSGFPVANSGFPTLIPTRSSLVHGENNQPSPVWLDTFRQQSSQYHTNFDNGMCKMLMFHVKGAMDDDKDGWPACGIGSLTPACLAGGIAPGRRVLARAPQSNPLACDCDPNDPGTHPFANEIFNDLKDNDCDGTIDEGVVIQ